MPDHSFFASGIRSRAPLRLGLAGGGTDLSPYCDDYGGSVLNVTIARHAYASLTPRGDGQVAFVANDIGERETLSSDPGAIGLDDGLRVHRAVYKRIMETYNDGKALPVTLISWVESPTGAGLGASSALVVAMIGAFQRLLGLPMGEFDIAHLAYEIERIDLGMSGGKQDQYAATFGGLNFMEFASGNRVIVNPLNLPAEIMCELEASLLLCFTGRSRLSSDVIDKQVSGLKSGAAQSIESMHLLKREALEMKAALLRGELPAIDDIFRRGWEAKKSTASGISNERIDAIWQAAMDAGARAGKISGAGGGGFMMLLVDPTTKHLVWERLESMSCQVSTCSIVSRGVESWSIPHIPERTASIA